MLIIMHCIVLRLPFLVRKIFQRLKHDGHKQSIIPFILIIFIVTHIFLTHMTSFWRLIFDEFFRLEGVIGKKYTSTTGKGSKDTNAIDKSIVWPCCGLYLSEDWSEDCSEDCSVLCSDDCSLFCSVLCSEDYSLLHDISSFLFFISAPSLWPWAMRSECFSRVINFFSSSVIFI